MLTLLLLTIMSGGGWGGRPHNGQIQLLGVCNASLGFYKFCSAVLAFLRCVAHFIQFKLTSIALLPPFCAQLCFVEIFAHLTQELHRHHPSASFWLVLHNFLLSGFPNQSKTQKIRALVQHYYTHFCHQGIAELSLV